MKKSSSSRLSLIASSFVLLCNASQANVTDATIDARSHTPQSTPPAPLFGALPPGTAASTTVVSQPGFTILDGVSVQAFVLVSGLDPYLWDIDFGASIQHTANGELDIRLMSPSLKEVAITSGNGGSNDNVFATTWWDDDASELTTDGNYSNNTNRPSLIPEGALAAFVGENPNGYWRVTVTDKVAGNHGTLSTFSLRLTTLTPSPMSAPAYAIAQILPIPIPDSPSPGVTATINVSTPGTSICDLDLQTFITHPYTRDLSFSLRSPLGTEVVVSNRRGEDLANTFNGTVFDDDAAIPVTDVTYVNNVAVPKCTPEGAFGAFHGENPNGAWKLKLQDGSLGDVGTLQYWSLVITTCAAPVPEPFCFGDGSGMQCPCNNNSPVGSERGCRNGLGRGAKLTGSGAQSVSSDTVQLLTEDTPFLSTVLYWQSRYSANMGRGIRFDDGLLCTQTPIVFLGMRFTDSALKTRFPEGGTPLHVVGNIPASGGTRFIQCWYRNAGNACGSESNLTNGVKMNWLP